MDLTYYIKHVAGHRFYYLWLAHSVHHSSIELNFSTSFRTSWHGQITRLVFWLPLILIGFPPTLVFISERIVSQAQVWIHTEHIGKLPFLDKIINTPSNHRVHHSSNPRHINKNFGGILMLWDKLFGSYLPEPEKEEMQYGLIRPINTANPIKVNCIVLLEFFTDLRKTHGLGRKIKIFFEKP